MRLWNQSKLHQCTLVRYLSSTSCCTSSTITMRYHLLSQLTSCYNCSLQFNYHIYLISFLGSHMQMASTKPIYYIVYSVCHLHISMVSITMYIATQLPCTYRDMELLACVCCSDFFSNMTQDQLYDDIRVAMCMISEHHRKYIGQLFGSHRCLTALN